MSDLDHRDDALTERLELVAKGDVLSARRALVGFVILTLLLLAVLGGIAGITLNTNTAVKDRQVLEDRNAELEELNRQLEDVNGQAVDAIVAMAEQIRQLGGTPPEVVLRPREPGE